MAQNNSAGTYNDMVQIWSIFAGTSAIQVEEIYPRNIRLYVTLNSLPVGQEAVILEFMDVAAPGGIRVTDIIQLTEPGDGIFKFDSPREGFDLGVFINPIVSR